MRRRSLLPALLVAFAALAAVSSSALAASAGTTFLTGGIDLPAGAIAGGQSGDGGDGADRIGVSGDGRYVAFVSEADTLDPAAHPDVVNVYRKDRLTGEVVLVSRATGAAGATAAASSVAPAISDDGRYVAFSTTAALDPADTDGGRSDVYVRNVLTATTLLASVGDGGGQTTSAVGGFDLSGNGRFVVFDTDSALDVGDLNGVSDVYGRDLLAGRTLLVSVAAAGGAAGNAASSDPAVSDDGMWVAFASSASNLVVPVPGGGRQVYARDITGAATYLVSARTGAPTAGGNGDSSEPDIAGAPAPGALNEVAVAYTSSATDLAAADTSSEASVFGRQLSLAASILLSRADGAAGASADSRAHSPSIGDAGRVVFSSDATNLGAGDDYYGVYVRNARTDSTLLVSADNSYAVQGAISGDSGFVAWYEVGATPDSDPDLGAVFGRTYDASASTLGAVELVSRPPGTAPFLATAIEMAGSSDAARTISADGRYVVFVSSTSRLPGGTPGGPAQVYRRDTLTGAIELVSRANGASGAPADSYNQQPSISADGTRVAFVSGAHLDPVHTGSSGQVYVRDLAAGTTTLASRADGPAGALPDAGAGQVALSADGTHVAFVSGATNLGAPGPDEHVYLRDLAAGTTTVVDRATGGAGAIGNDDASAPSPSADGRLVAFASRATNLDPDDPAGLLRDVYVRDTVAGTTLLASRRSGLAGTHATGESYAPSISADGKVVAFRADDETLAPEGGAWGGNTQIVARTLATGANVLVSRNANGAVANERAESPSVNGDGSVVAFASWATNLLPDVGGIPRHGVFARTMTTGALGGPPAFGLVGFEWQHRAQSPSISDDGQCLAFHARGHNAATGTAGDLYTSYVYVVSGVCPKPLPVAIPPVARRVARPVLAARLVRRCFRVGRRATARTAAAARRARCRKVGTTFLVRLNVRANVAIAIERPAQGRLVGRFCRRPAPRYRRRLRCVRFVRVGRLTRGGLPTGASRIAFSGRIGRKALRPGRYRARVRATNSAGASAWVRLSFTVARRRR